MRLGGDYLHSGQSTPVSWRCLIPRDNYINRVGGCKLGAIAVPSTAGRVLTPYDHHLVLVFDAVQFKMRDAFLSHAASKIE